LAESLGVSEKVNFVGSLPSGAPVFEWLDTIDIYLHPSLTEGMPRSLIEAMSRACPALASNAGGIPELVGANETTEVGDYDDLAIKITELVQSKERQMLLAERNFFSAASYCKEALDARRDKFWVKFKEHVVVRK
jgi:glycosyltransferase involved in cell wall biosynthesis